MFKPSDDSKYPDLCNLEISDRRYAEDGLEPEDGKDEAYDTIMAEIKELEEQLSQELEEYETQLGYDCRFRSSYSTY